MDGQLVVTANGNGNVNGVSNSIASAIDPQVLIDHLSRLLQVTLGATDEDLNHPDSLFGSSKAQETSQRCTRFGQEAQAASMYIQKWRTGSSTKDDASEGEGMISVCTVLIND